MPIVKCSIDGSPGFRWGSQGKCYTYDPDSEDAKQAAYDKAVAQGVAARASGYTGEDTSVDLPGYVISALEKGLKLYTDGHGGEGLVDATLSQARKGVRDGRWSNEKIIKASAWFARHVADRARMKNPRAWDDPPSYSPAYVSWLLWGSDSNNRGKDWIDARAEKIKSEMSEAPGDRVSSTPAPPEDRIKGGRNTGRASGASKSSIKLSKSTNNALQKKVDDHNEKHGDQKGKRTTLRTLQKVYLRGSGAFSTSHRPGMTRAQWSYARVNAFLYLLRNGRPKDPKYVTDNDLLPSSHPKSTKESRDRTMDDYSNEGHMGSKERVLKAMLFDVEEILKMADDVEKDALVSILKSTHERYMKICGYDSGKDYDVDVDVDVDAPDERISYRRRRVAMGNSVEDPTSAQRSGLPPAAYEPAAYFEDGTFSASKSKLPHHVNTVKDPMSNETVDVPRLRNALARFDQVDWSGFPEGTMMKTRAHLERHADSVLRSEDGSGCKSCSEEELRALKLDLEDFRMNNHREIRARLLNA